MFVFDGLASVVAYCNASLSALSVAEQLSAIEGQLLKSCKNRAAILISIEEAVSSICGAALGESEKDLSCSNGVCRRARELD